MNNRNAPLVNVSFQPKVVGSIPTGRMERKMTAEKATYDAGAVEAARQEAWSRRRAFDTPEPTEGQVPAST